MIKPKLTLLQMQRKSMFRYAIELSQAALGKAPKGFNTVDMTASPDKLIVAMINPKVFIKANINQPIVTSPAIGVDDTQRISFASDNRLQGTLRSIWNNLCVNLIAAFKQPKDNGFTASATTTFTTHSAWAEVRLIGLQITTQWRAFKAPLSHAQTHAKVDIVDTAQRNTTQCRAFGSSQILSKMFNNLTKFGLAKFRMVEIPVFMNHFKELACVEHMFAF